MKEGQTCIIAPKSLRMLSRETRAPPGMTTPPLSNSLLRGALLGRMMAGPSGPFTTTSATTVSTMLLRLCIKSEWAIALEVKACSASFSSPAVSCSWCSIKQCSASKWCLQSISQPAEVIAILLQVVTDPFFSSVSIPLLSCPNPLRAMKDDAIHQRYSSLSQKSSL